MNVQVYLLHLYIVLIMIRKYYFLLFTLILVSAHSVARTVLVNTVSEVTSALKSSNPGDTILFASKEWKDASLVINAKGTKEKPVILMPQTPGGVVFTGNSDVRIGGEYIVFNGFHFKDGFAKRKAVIEFRINESTLANDCRITNCVIENYSKPRRFDSDSWIVLWGKRNRVDHNTFVEKLNAGPVLIAELNDERSQQNFHLIDSNYFKGRPRFGSNGGETIRIGVSRYSLTPSNTQIVYNYFERCSGEVEIVSIKSGNNNISHNTFFECEGGLVLRHGADNVINGNVFLGNNKPYTGGVRVINPGHTVTNNIFKDLKGQAFRSALSIVNGVPNSLINRYYQATDITITNNTFINSASILFGAGKDAERTLSPQRVKFSNNLIVNPGVHLYKDDNKDGGIVFSNNAVSSKANITQKGFTKVNATTASVNGVQFHVHNKYGAQLKDIAVMNDGSTGAKWYRPVEVRSTQQPQVFKVLRAEAAKIPEIIGKASANDIIELSEEGLYKLENEIIVDKPLVIKAAEGLKEKPEFVNVSYRTMPGFIVIENGGSLLVKNIRFNGAYESFGNVQAGIKSTDKPMNRSYSLTIDGCEFFNYNESSYAGFKAEKSTYADSVIVMNSLFRNISGTGVNIAEEKDDKGIYGAENVIIKNSVFTNLLGAAINVYRGGNDESTTGPSVFIDYCTFNEVENREQGTAVRLVGAQTASVTNSIFSNSGSGGRAIEFREYRWDNIKVDYCNFYRSGRVESFYNKVLGKNIFRVVPGFRNPAVFDFNLSASSALRNKSSEGKNLGAAL